MIPASLSGPPVHPLRALMVSTQPTASLERIGHAAWPVQADSPASAHRREGKVAGQPPGVVHTAMSKDKPHGRTVAPIRPWGGRSPGVAGISEEIDWLFGDGMSRCDRR
jgi:hypothetical protein